MLKKIFVVASLFFILPLYSQKSRHKRKKRKGPTGYQLKKRVKRHNSGKRKLKNMLRQRYRK